MLKEPNIGKLPLNYRWVMEGKLMLILFMNKDIGGDLATIELNG